MAGNAYTPDPTPELKNRAFPSVPETADSPQTRREYTKVEDSLGKVAELLCER